MTFAKFWIALLETIKFGVLALIVAPAIVNTRLEAFPAGRAAMVSGGGSSLALTEDGHVWGWGHNQWGEVGDGSRTVRREPVAVLGLSNVTAIASGYAHSLALTEDAEVWTWGYNAQGQLGDGQGGVAWAHSAVPVRAEGLPAVTAVAAGYNHSMVLTGDGEVWAWGQNDWGQIGDGTHGTNRFAPVRVTGLTGIRSISAGFYHSLALDADNQGWAWGFNDDGQLGDGTRVLRRPAPVRSVSGDVVTLLAIGSACSLSLTDEGALWIWGGNNNQQLTDEITATRSVDPVWIAGISNMLDAAGSGHILALRDDGTVWSWGANAFGQTGDGTTESPRGVPAPAIGLTNAVHVAAGHLHSLAVDRDGHVWTWGRNSFGALGDGDNRDRSQPYRLPAFGPVQYRLTYTAGPGGVVTGRVEQVIDHGGSGAAVTAIADHGAIFKIWSDGKTNALRQDMNVTTDINVQAEFATTGGVDIGWYHRFGIEPDAAEGWRALDDRYNPCKGMTLRQEYLAGTNPNDPESVFRVVSFVVTADGNTLLAWTGGTNGVPIPYVVERSTNIMAGWHAVTNVPREHATIYTWTDDRSIEQPVYYRIHVPGDD